MQANSRNVNTMNSRLDKKASLKAKYPRIFESLGKLKGELRPEISILHMKVLTLIKAKSYVFL